MSMFNVSLRLHVYFKVVLNGIIIAPLLGLGGGMGTLCRGGLGGGWDFCGRVGGWGEGWPCSKTNLVQF